MLQKKKKPTSNELFDQPNVLKRQISEDLFQENLRTQAIEIIWYLSSDKVITEPVIK